MSEEPTTAAPGTEPKSYTQEELTEMRESAMNFYKAELKVLRLRAEYEKLHADIEESKFRKITAIHRQAEYYAQMENAMAENEEKDPSDGGMDNPENPDSKQPRQLKRS